MYIDKIKLFAKNVKELEILIQAIRIYNQDIGMEFDIEKCTMLIMRRGKRQMIEGIELTNQEKTRMLQEKETYEYLRILEAGTMKQVEMKEKIKKEYIRRKRKLLETKLHRTYLIKRINTWAIPLVRYLGLFLKWTRQELQQIEKRTR